MSMATLERAILASAGEVVVRRTDWRANPFCKAAPPHWGVEYTEICCAEDRIAAVRTMGIAELEAVLKFCPDVQVTVASAAKSRLNRLKKLKAKEGA